MKRRSNKQQRPAKGTYGAKLRGERPFMYGPTKHKQTKRNAEAR